MENKKQRNELPLNYFLCTNFYCIYENEWKHFAVVLSTSGTRKVLERFMRTILI